MSATVLHSARALGSTGTTSTASITAPTPGKTLLVAVVVPTASVPATPATALEDNLGNIYDLDLSGGGVYGGRTVYFYRKSNIPNAPTSLSMAGSSSFAAVFQVLEVAGLDNASPFVSTVPKTDMSGGTSQTTHVASVTTTNPNDFVLIATNGSNGDPLSSASNGFSVVQTPVYDDLLYAAYLPDAGAAGTKTTALTFSGWTSALYFAVVYKAAPSGPTVSSVTSNSATEGSSIVHTVTLSAAVTGSAATYPFTISGVDATGSGIDFTSTLSNEMFSHSVTVSGGNITVPVGVTSFTVTIPTSSDLIVESTETYTLTIGGISGTGTITDGPIATISDAIANNLAGEITFTVTLSLPAPADGCSIMYATNDISATAGVNYTATSGTLSFASGESTKTISIPILP